MKVTSQGYHCLSNFKKEVSIGVFSNLR